ncbi:hypothetical protein SCP_1700260 [Sparassis crispa]|uniref:Protein kinase domain-containing protein n=1 Tax=Sparassis crispa TaxID=139825 RepID=A0A401H5L2_9APHY|nr:hypothetical protein SCP_1700260 [Sparassis crispa]GBE89702.1 hypothetical protein SCP_1700260 [Sparassis crispa]
MALLSFPSLIPDDRFPQFYDLLPVLGSQADDGPHNNVQLTLTDVVCIHKGKKLSAVYRATLRATSDSPEAAEHLPREVVCKVVYGRPARDKLHFEFSMYDKLQDLQGRLIPQCFGLYEGEMDDGRAACLLLEYCGEELTRKLRYTSWDFRRQVLDSLLEIHRRGVVHNDVRERNIVINKEGRPIIVDFDISDSKNHDCPVKLPIQFDVPEPDRFHFGCDELHWAGQLADVWLPTTFLFLGRRVPIKYTDSPELLAKVAPSGTSPEEALERAHVYYQMFRTALEKRKRCEPYEYLDNSMVDE